jgi:hypothetical protein
VVTYISHTVLLTAEQRALLVSWLAAGCQGGVIDFQGRLRFQATGNGQLFVMTHPLTYPPKPKPVRIEE